MAAVPYLVLVWLHLLAAAVWVGGLAFFVLVLVPELRTRREGVAALMERLGYRFRTVGWAVLVFLVLSGLQLARVRGLDLGAPFATALWETDLGHALLAKVSLVAATLAVSGVHDYYVGPRATALWQAQRDSAEARRWRAWARGLGRINMLLAVAVLGAAVCVVRGLPHG
ncbi:MAG TPA: CopD family protein [Myxococcota bacterium]|nr:CopD family protein [Myxococcota bacterium]